MVEVDWVMWMYVCIVGLFSFGSCCVMAGLLYSSLHSMRESREALQAQAVHFGDILKKASAANLSQADKLTEMADRIDNLESWRTMMGVAESSKGSWKT